MTADLAALAVANLAVLLAGHGTLRLVGFRPPLRDLVWSLGVAYVAGAAALGLLGSLALVAGLSLTWWQILALCLAVAAAGLVRPAGVTPQRPRATAPTRLAAGATLLVLAVLAVDLVVQPIWTDDAWSIWAAKATSVVAFDGLDATYLASASVFNADYPLLVPVVELVALRFGGLETELLPLQAGLVFLAFPFALVAVLADRVPALLAWLVAFAVALAPTLQIQTASTVADVPLAVFFALAGVAAWRWLEEGERRWLWLAAFLAAAAVATKVEGAAFAVVLLLAVAVAARARGRSLAELGVAALGVAATALPWELWSRAHDLQNAISQAGGPVVPGAGTAVERGASGAVSMLRELADPSSWLALVLLAAAAVAVGLLRRPSRSLALFTLAVTAGALASLLVVYVVTPLDFDYHLARSVRRVVTAPALFAAALAPLLLVAAAEDHRPR